MTLSVRQPESTLPSTAEKALLLCQKLGLCDTTIDELLALPAAPKERRAASRQVPARAASSQGTVVSEGEDPGRAAVVARLRRLLGARDVLLQLAAACESAAGVLAASLGRSLVGLVEPAPLPALVPLRPARDRTIGRRYGILRLPSPTRR